MIFLEVLQTSVIACIRLSGDIFVLFILVEILTGLPDHRTKFFIDVHLMLTTSAIYGLVKFLPKFRLVLLLGYSKTLIENSNQASLTRIHFIVLFRRLFPSTIILIDTAIVKAEQVDSLLVLRYCKIHF